MSKLSSTIRIALGTVALASAVVGSVVSTSTDAHSVTPGNRVNQSAGQRPVGTVACDALWMHDHTAADEQRCRDRGWTVNAIYVLSASGDRMWTGYGPCTTEDGRRCYWNARTMGNHCGTSFVNLGPLGTFLGLVEINGRRADNPCPRCGPQH